MEMFFVAEMTETIFHTFSRSWLGSALKIWPGMPGHYKAIRS
jgi:hypothetical protein